MRSAVVILFCILIAAVSAVYGEEDNEDADDEPAGPVFVDIETCMVGTELPWLEIDEPFLPGETRKINRTSAAFLVAFSESRIVISSRRLDIEDAFPAVASNKDGCLVIPTFYDWRGADAEVVLGCFDRESGGCHVMYSFRDFYLQEKESTDGSFLMQEEEEE